MTPSSSEQQWSNLSLLRMSGYGFGMIGFGPGHGHHHSARTGPRVGSRRVEEHLPGCVGIQWAHGRCHDSAPGGTTQRSDQLASRTENPLHALGGDLCLSWTDRLGFAPNYATLFAVWLFMQANFNIGYGPSQALIRDLVPLSRVGAASSLKDPIGCHRGPVPHSHQQQTNRPGHRLN